MRAFLKERPFHLSVIALAAGWYFEHHLLATTPGNLLGFAVLFAVIIYSALSVAHHAEMLAERFGEPYGTLILTMSAVIVEIVIIVIMMLHEHNPTLARDTVYAAVMLDINGLLGFAAIAGGIKYGEQPYNVDSSNSYLAMLMVAVGVAMIIPDFLPPEHYQGFMLFNVVIFVMLYIVFTRIQLKDHRYFFTYDRGEEPMHQDNHPHEKINAIYHTVLLVASIVMIGLLSELLSVFMSNSLKLFGLPMAIAAVGVAVISAAPELITADRAALDNRMQTVINIAMGASLATVLLTVPAVILIARITGLDIRLGLSPVQGVMLALTLLTGMINFNDGETNVLEGFMHFILFAVFVFLLFL